MSEIDIAPSSGEVLYGVRAIAAFLGIKDRQALHLVEQRRIPFFRIGRAICARRSTLATWIVEQEAKGTD